jgi:hypothetical protein
MCQNPAIEAIIRLKNLQCALIRHELTFDLKPKKTDIIFGRTLLAILK